MDNHDDKVWALVTSKDENTLVTGGEDSTIQWSRNITEEERQKRLEEAAKLASEEQTLLNLIQQKKWAKALAIAIRLNQPMRGFRIIREIIDETPEELSDVINRLREDQLSTLLEYCVQWNTKTKNSREAQVCHIFIFLFV